MRSRRRLTGTVAALLVTVVISAACGVPDQGQPEIITGFRPTAHPSAASGPQTADSARIRLFFVDNSDQIAGVTRSNPGPALPTAMTTLLAGPTTSEMAVGLTTAIPSGTKLDSSRRSGTTAFLDFSSTLASVTGREQLLAFAQIVLTADSLPAVDEVQISIAGQVVNAPEPDGTLAQGPVKGGDYASLVRG